MKSSEIDLELTCAACPEQYDATYNGKQVGYLRLRHGAFRVTCPDVSGEEVYYAEPEGDGIFDDDERERYLTDARRAIADWLRERSDE